MKTRRRLMAVGFLSGLAILGAVVQAQAPAGATPGKIYTRKCEFELPVKFDANQRGRLSEVQLYVKQGAADIWKVNQKGPAATQSKFRFKAPSDGEYWFNLVTVDVAGKMNPADVGKEAPSLMVVVDSQAPECEVRPATSSSGELLFQCDIRDANPDHSKTKLEFLTTDRQWQGLEAHPSQIGSFRIPDPVLLKGMVRATVYDRANNCTTREFNLAAMTTVAGMTPPANQPVAEKPAMPMTTSMPPAPTMPAPAPVAPMQTMAPAMVPSMVPATATPMTPPVAPAPAPTMPVATPVCGPAAAVPMTVPGQQIQLASTASAAMTPPAPTPVHTQPVIHASHTYPASQPCPAIQTVACTNPAACAIAGRYSSSPPLQMVNGKHVALDYQVDQMGPSGLGKVEVWLTHDEGQSWHKVCDDPDRHSPVEFDLPTEGTYGLAMVLCSGSGLEGAPPARGDTPDWWVEVDCTKPLAQLLAVRPCSKDEPGTYLITWTASDKNLKPEPVDLYYSSRKEGPWQPIAKGLKNDGNYRWQLPPGLQGEIFVRLDVTDRAGNTTHCEASQGSFMDLTRPKARVIGIATPRACAMPAGN